jgi:threonine dehydratase
VVTVTHYRAYFGVHLGDTIIDITMETRGPDHIVELMAELKKAGYEFERVL